MRRTGLVAALCLGLAWLAAPSPARAGDDDCLGCHGDQDAKSDRGRSVYVDQAGHKASVHSGLGCSDCHAGRADYPHPRKAPRATCADCHDEAVQHVGASLHGALGEEACTGCHGGAHEVKAPGRRPGAECAACHEDQVKAYGSGVHARVRSAGDGDGAICASCHGPAHRLRPASDASSPIARKNLADTCAGCHADADFLARHKIPLARPVEAYRLSVHGRAVAAGNDKAAICSDCHTSHDVRQARDPASPIQHWNVAATCGRCHTEVHKTFEASIHGQALKRGVREAPACTDCHGEHAILAPSEPGSLVNPARVSSATCGHCHADERLAAKFNLPLDKVPAYRDSYHGLAQRSGRQTVANCASCHGVHDILPSSDPRSRVHPGNLARTCGACHPGAGERFAIGPVHVRAATASEHAVVRFIRVAYQWLIPLTVAFMLGHHLLDFLAKLRRPRPRHDSGEQVPRMGRHFRIAHGLVVLSFPTLVVTGFALKFPETWWAAPLLAFEGRFGLRGIVHRGAGVVLVLALVYHAAHLVLSRRARRILPALLPGVKDARDLIGAVLHNLGRRAERPPFGAFSYVEKIEYWAFVWGTVVMAVSGFLLWFNTWALRHVPTWVLDASTAVHYYEAILASLAILIWHFYTVIFDPDVYPMDRAWITGRTSADHLRHTRPEHYRELRAALDSASASATAATEKPEPPKSED